MNRLSDLHRREDGSVIFSATVLLIGFALLIGYVGNMWAELIEKQNTQASADSAAYSASVWRARGMNTVCTCNHLMGELTSLVVILEALGGPEAGSSPFEPCGTDQSQNSMIESVLGLSKSQSDIAAFAKFDAKFVDLLYKLFVSSHTRHYCGAAIYDAELALKAQFASALMGKCVGTVMEIIGKIPFLKPVGWIGTAIHGIIDLPLGLELLPELLKDRMLEMLVSAIAPVKDLVRIVIPVLGAYSAEIASIGVTQGAVRTSILDTTNRVAEFYGLDACVAVPGNLPVQRESGPAANAKSKQQPTATPWKSSDRKSSFIDTINTVVNKIGIAKPIMYGYYLVAKATPRRFRSSNQKKIVEQYPKISQYSSKMKAGIPSEGYDDNPSRNKLKSFDLDAEKLTQFVRATNPYVDSARSPMRGWFRDQMPVSNISTYFTHWSYRYTLNESFCLRNGEHGIPAQMLVLEGWDAKKKGNENWTDDPDGADRTFSLVVGVQGREREPVFAPSVYLRARPNGDVAIAQGMIYNLNARAKTVTSSGSNLQPTTGWDTLQWEPQSGTVRAPEWNAQPSGPKGKLAPWEFFNKRSLSTNDGARVKLNWQAKLRPVTEHGARTLADDSGVPDAIRSVSGVVADHAVLLSH